jgi:hypothetical protein
VRTVWRWLVWRLMNAELEKRSRPISRQYSVIRLEEMRKATKSQAGKSVEIRSRNLHNSPKKRYDSSEGTDILLIKLLVNIEQINSDVKKITFISHSTCR